MATPPQEKGDTPETIVGFLEPLSLSLSLPVCVARCCLHASVHGVTHLHHTHARSSAAQVLCNSGPRANLIMPVPLLHMLESDDFGLNPEIHRFYCKESVGNKGTSMPG